MKRAIKSAFGLTPVWRISSLLRKPGCAVVTYHRVGAGGPGFKQISAASFRQQMQWLRTHCTIVDADGFRAACGHASRVRPSVLVTFDDGYRDYHDVAYPILRDLRIPAINFVVSGFADRPDRLFWWDQVDLAVWSSGRGHFEAFWRSGERVRLDAAGRQWARMDVRRYIWSRPNDERDGILDRFCDALGVHRDELRCERQVMTWDEIRSVSELTTIGGHTHTHPLVSRVDAAQLRREVTTCRDRIAAELERPTTFAYPSGAVSETAKRVLHEEGFDLAFGGARGVNGADADWMAIKRINAPSDPMQLAYLLSGISTRSAA
jgi:peptidoglycan/xylan/chitin deacetylase (PgdA/CDA1 family)